MGRMYVYQCPCGYGTDWPDNPDDGFLMDGCGFIAHIRRDLYQCQDCFEFFNLAEDVKDKACTHCESHNLRFVEHPLGGFICPACKKASLELFATGCWD